MRWELPRTDQLSEIKGPRPLNEGWYVVTMICWSCVGGDTVWVVGVVVGAMLSVGVLCDEWMKRSPRFRMAALSISLESNSKG